MELNEKIIPAEREYLTNKTKVREWLGEFLDVDRINPRILKRLEFLNERTNFVEEEKESVQKAKAFFDYYKKNSPEKAFSEKDEMVVEIGLIFADIGKTGPASANEQQQSLIIKLYNIEGVTAKDKEKTLRDFLEGTVTVTSKSDDLERDLELLRQMKISPSITIEQFWRLHSRWTLEIIEGDGIPREYLPGAVFHHVLAGDNVDLMDDKGHYKEIVIDGKVVDRFGDNHDFDRPERLVEILDFYEASMSRIKNATHEQAIQKLYEKVKGNERFKNDPQYLELIGDFDKMIREQKENG